ncbi:MAG TPA: prolyl oligopeptidase family serine peptidase [Candidatus Sulfotelmatobacter sp.]|nr:prolyl oligopeptidase family serine peptidase [Candidatus Sulfotelmatobacter sp.]
MAAPITPEDLYRFRWIDHVRLSPDGERVAYQVGWADANSRQNRSRILVRRVLDPEPVGPSAGALRDHSPEWSPDGLKLAFVSKVGAADQLFVTDLVAGGPAQQLSQVPDGVSSPAWSPDGSRIAFLATVLADPDVVVDDPRPPEGREQLRRAPVVRVVRRLDYKHDGQGYVDGRYHHLFSARADGSEVKQLTHGAWDVHEFDWSPDGQRIVFSGNAEPGADLMRELNLYVVDLDGNRHRLGGGLYLSAPIWSPKGDEIAFIAPSGLDVGLLERLWVVPLDGNPPRCLTTEFDLGVNDSVINDMRAGHSTRTCWSADGERIYFLACGPGVTSLYSVDLEGNVREEAGGRRRIYDFDIASSVTAFCASDATNPGELFVVAGGAEARLTDLNPWLGDCYVAEPEQHYFTAPDGWRLEGWILKPENLDPNRLYPTLMEIHGGPHAQYGWSFFHELQILAGMGYVVFYMNPRGSDGYGERFRREVVRDWAGKDYTDLMSSLDQIVERTGYIDTNRLGVGGGSYGGYMTNWIIGQTDRFSAAVSMRSISNLVSEYAQHDIVLWGALQLGPPPWPDMDELWRRSPIRYVQNMKTPLLLTAAEMDLRCAMSQSEELFGAMRLLGKTVELVRFPEETHDLSRSGRPDRRVERLRRIAAWFSRFLGTQAVDRPAPEEETQILAVPADAPREWAKTVSISSRPPELEPVAVEEPVLVAEESAAVAVEEPAEVIQPLVPDFATAEAPIVEPEALPDLPTPGSAIEEPLISEPGPELPPQPQPEPVAESAPEAVAEPEPEPEAEPVPETEPVPEPMAVVEPEPAAAEPSWGDFPDAERGTEPEHAAEPEPEPEPTAATAAETATSAFDEPVAAEPEPTPELEPVEEPEPEPVVVQAEPEPAPEPERTLSPEPEPVVAAQAQPAAEAAATPEVTSTLLHWPSNTPSAGRDNGAPSESPSFEEATSVIPAWQQTDPNADPRRTVSLQAMPPEEIASGSGFAAMLTFETGPFAGRIVALPSQMVSIGRAPDNDVVVGDPATSGHHGRIDVRSGSFWVSDLGSTNGTLVNGEPVIEKQLSDGDMISIGQNTVRFTLEA